MKNGPIGQYLLEKGLITEEQLNEILEIKKIDKNKLFGEIVVEKGFVSEIEFSKCLADRLNVPFIDLAETELNPEVVSKIPEAVAKKCLNELKSVIPQAAMVGYVTEYEGYDLVIE